MASTATAPAPNQRVRRRFMADGDTTPPSMYGPLSYPTNVNPIGYNPTGDPVQAAISQRQWAAGQGDALQSNDANLANQYAQQAYGTQSYLNPIEQGLASGQGGYNPTEQSQIELTPQQQQDITTKAGISAGAGTASAVGAAERAGAAAGGNPAATATYRARAAQTEGANAGDAMTGARIAAQQAGSAGAQAVGNARMNQQAQGAGYLGNLQAQQSTASQNEQGLGQGAYGTQTNATGAATGQQIAATELPTIADKLIGTGAGIAGALADGRPAIKNAPGYLDDGMDAVIGEDGPEAVIEAGRPHMADGGMSPLDALNNDVAMKAISGGLNGYSQKPGSGVGGGWNKATPYSQAGTAIGSLIKKFTAKKPANPYSNAAADSTGTYTMPGGSPTSTVASSYGPGDDEMTSGANSYLADGDIGFGDDSNDTSNADAGSKTNPDGTPKKSAPKVTSPEQNIRNYLNGAMANALRPPTPDAAYSLQAGLTPRVPAGGGNTTPPALKGTAINSNTSVDVPPPSAPPPSMPPVTTSFPPPAPKGTAINSNTSIDVPPPPPATRLPVTTSWTPQPKPTTNTGSDSTIQYPDLGVGDPSNPPATASTPGAGANSAPPPPAGLSSSTIQYPDLGVGDVSNPAPPPQDTWTPPDFSMPSGGQQDYSTPGNQGSSDSSIYYPDFGEGDPTNAPGVGDDPGYINSQYPEMAQPPANELFGNAPDFGGGFNDWGSVGDDGSIYGGSGGQDLNLGDSADPSEWDADGRVGNGQHMANGGMRPGFKWTERVGKQLHAPAGGYTPLNLHPKPMMADGGIGGYGSIPDNTITSPPNQYSVDNNGLPLPGYNQTENNGRPPKYSSEQLTPDGVATIAPEPGSKYTFDEPWLNSSPQYGGGSYGPPDGNEMSNDPSLSGSGGYGIDSTSSEPSTNWWDGIGGASGDWAGGVGSGEDSGAGGGFYANGKIGSRRPMMADGWSGGGVKVVNSPTKVKLAPGDQVVPLSFRPKAKIRPSAALPALQSAMRTRPMFGAQR